MKTVIIDCQNISQESELWQVYLETVQPEGGGDFGRNIAAFWDAVSGGGPGWPGEVQLLFANAEALASIDNGELLHRLKDIQTQSQQVRVVLGAAI